MSGMRGYGPVPGADVVQAGYRANETRTVQPLPSTFLLTDDTGHSQAA